ncbi:hypothetical protein AB1Y20_011341 [Prymnesium parvum]|uniref:Uncharacterized protein n=1 Tax=Prymnesium parvum TaxID=97485 RepID=A0AB34IP99_PRYPA
MEVAMGRREGKERRRRSVWRGEEGYGRSRDCGAVEVCEERRGGGGQVKVCDEGVEVEGVEVEGVEVEGVEVEGVEVEGVEVEGVEVEGVEVEGVEVEGVKVEGVEVKGVEVEGVEVKGVEVEGVEVARRVKEGGKEGVQDDEGRGNREKSRCARVEEKAQEVRAVIGSKLERARRERRVERWVEVAPRQ